MTQLVISVEGEENTVLNISDDTTFRGADLGKLDADLVLIKYGQLEVKLPEDTYDYDSHKWETAKGAMIGELFKLVDEGVEF